MNASLARGRFGDPSQVIWSEIRVDGRVQGVGFRAWTRRLAHTLGLIGLVENSPDGSVRIVVQGSNEHLSQFISALHQGPPAARVRNVECTPLDSGPRGLHSFTVRCDHS